MNKTGAESVEYSQEEHDRLCTEVLYNPWTFERYPCKREAVQTIGGQFAAMHPLRFCDYHWHDFKAQADEELISGSVLDFLRDSVLSIETLAILREERARVRAELKAEQERLQESLREQQRAVRAVREAQRHLSRDAAALSFRFDGASRVYFIQAGKRGPIKIGTARDVLKRLDELQTGNPQRLRVRATLPGGHAREHEYHRLFAAHRMAGEWFRPVAVIRAEIDRINKIKHRGEGALF